MPADKSMAGDNSSHLFCIIASYLRKRGLVKTLATFLKESDVKINDAIGEVDLETLYTLHMPIQTSGISKKRKKKSEIADDLSDKGPNLIGVSNGRNDQGLESLGASVETVKSGNDFFAGEGPVPSKISSAILTKDKMMKGGEVLESHMKVQGQENGVDGTVRQRKKQKKETDNAGHHSTPVLQECQRGGSKVETENGNKKQSKRKTLKMDGNATDEKFHEEAKTTEEKKKRKKKGCKKEPNGNLSEVNITVDSFELQDKIDFVKTQKSENKLSENNKYEDNNPENNLKKKSVRKGKKVESGADPAQQVFSQVGQVFGDSTTQEEACASNDKNTAFVEAGQIQHIGDLNCFATLNRSKKSVKTKKKHGDEEMPGCDMVVQDSGSKKCHKFESLDAMKGKKSLEEDGMLTKKQKISRKIEKGSSSEDTVVKTTNQTTEDIENRREVIGGKHGAEASTKLAGNAGMVDFKDDHVLSAKKENKNKESRKKKKATDKIIEVNVTSSAENANLITGLEDIDKGKGEVVDVFVGQPEAMDVNTKKQKDTSSHIDKSTGASAFRRVDMDQVQYSDSRLKDNSYWAKGGADQGYGAKAQEKLELVRGRDFRHEKTKKKRGSYRGGLIDLQSHSIKFDHSDED